MPVGPLKPGPPSHLLNHPNVNRSSYTRLTLASARKSAPVWQHASSVVKPPSARTPNHGAIPRSSVAYQPCSMEEEVRSFHRGATLAPRAVSSGGCSSKTGYRDARLLNFSTGDPLGTGKKRCISLAKQSR